MMPVPLRFTFDLFRREVDSMSRLPDHSWTLAQRVSSRNCS